MLSYTESMIYLDVMTLFYTVQLCLTCSTCSLSPVIFSHPNLKKQCFLVPFHSLPVEKKINSLFFNSNMLIDKSEKKIKKSTCILL